MIDSVRVLLRAYVSCSRCSIVTDFCRLAVSPTPHAAPRLLLRRPFLSATTRRGLAIAKRGLRVGGGRRGPGLRGVRSAGRFPRPEESRSGRSDRGGPRVARDRRTGPSPRLEPWAWRAVGCPIGPLGACAGCWRLRPSASDETATIRLPRLPRLA